MRKEERKLLRLEPKNELEKALWDYEDKFDEVYSLIETDKVGDKAIMEDIYSCIKDNKPKVYEWEKEKRVIKFNI